MRTHRLDPDRRKSASLLIVGGDPVVRDLLLVIAKRRGFAASVAAGPDEARAIIERERPAMVLVDPRTWGRQAGTMVGRLCAEACEASVTVLVDGSGTLTRAEVKKAGASAVLPYPLDRRALDATFDLIETVSGGTAPGKA